ncbi:MAG TPA: DUF2203 domain-containing protein [Candidatus Dormibacteraeota bacterium]|nr:DUF2203 domain-containing protein [Candidatus Dormibacteraeota bacterium]
MTRFYSIDDVDERLPEVRDVLTRLREQRDHLVELRDQAVERLAAVGAGGGAMPEGELDEALASGDPELRRLRLRMQGVIDQMQAAVGQLDGWDIVLRDIQTGLVDFPALVNGRQVWLCWRLGEPSLGWWHELEAGVAGRKPLIELL